MVRGIGSSIYTKFFERDIGAVKTSYNRAIDVVSSERTYKQRNAVFYNMVRAYHVVEDRITLFVRPFRAYHVYGTFAGGSHRAYICHVQRI